MNQADNVAFVQEVTVTAELLLGGRELSEEAGWALWQALEKYDLREVVAALRHWREHERFFPRPSELKDWISEAREARERRAQKALPPHEPTAEEQAATEAAQAAFFALVRGLEGGMSPRRQPVAFPLVAPEEQARHETRKQEALRRAGGE